MGRLLNVVDAGQDPAPWTGRPRALVELWSFRSEACRAQGPLVVSLAAAMPADVDVFKVNVDECPRHTATLGIGAVPALIEFRGGEAVRTWIGAWSVEEVLDPSAGNGGTRFTANGDAIHPVRAIRDPNRDSRPRRARAALEMLNRAAASLPAGETRRWRGWETMHESMLQAVREGELIAFQASPRIAPQLCGGGGEVYLERLARRCGPDAAEFFLSTFQETLCGEPADLVNVRGTPITRTSMRHLYHLAVLHRFSRAYYGERITVVEIGGGFGNLARLCLQYGIARRYAIVDFPVAHAIQYFYASEFVAEDRIRVWTSGDASSCGHGSDGLELLQPADVERFAATVEGPLLLVSTMALTEIPREGQDRYLSTIPATAYYVYGQRTTNALPGTAPANDAGELSNGPLFSRLADLCHPVSWESGEYYAEFLGLRH